MKSFIAIFLLASSGVLFGFDTPTKLENNFVNFAMQKDRPFPMKNNRSIWGNQFSLLNASVEPTYGKGKSAALISLAAPGVGLYMANKNKLSLALLPLCYGLVGGGAYMMSSGKTEAEDAYANYLVEKNPALQDELLEAADLGAEKNLRGQQYLIGGLSLWAFQTVWTFVYGHYNDKYRKRNANWNNPITSVYGGYDPITNTTSLNLTLKL